MQNLLNKVQNWKDVEDDWKDDAYKKAQTSNNNDSCY